ncbi:glycosyl hydrolase family 18 protein [Symbiobacterium thermophilum]|uniref:glycosyl hydrolase family 18 protein n=1 Tax=Symbiobacterium thermophilum TaxID=2734 RepID=UPI0002F2AA5F|nr:glycosyl hydrolase family 18 protein [Symbiobacterium thermophilum]
MGLLIGALLLAGTVVAGAPGLPAGALPVPAELQSGRSWVLPDLAGDGWVVLTAEPPAVDEGPVVVAYYAEDWEGDVRALNALRRAGARVDRVVNFALELHADGSVTTRSYPALAAAAAELGVPVYGLVHNMQNGQFSAEIARAVLSDPARRSRAVADMLAIAREHGLAGIDIDIENVPGDLRAGYTALAAEAAAVLKPGGIRLTLSVPAKTWDDTTSNWGGAFDYAALGEIADEIAIMAYDEHTWGLPHGPVASLPWVERVVAYAVTQIPPEKILLGIPAYGYDWIAGTRQVVGGLSTGGAYSLAARHGAEVRWDDEAQVPWFRYVADGAEHIVYFENSRSAAAKLRLVGRYGLGGIAIWRLGLNEDGLWEVVVDHL